jgi:hypothetical protein
VPVATAPIARHPPPTLTSKAKTLTILQLPLTGKERSHERISTAHCVDSTLSSRRSVFPSKPLFTEVRGRGILRNPYAGSYIDRRPCCLRDLRFASAGSCTELEMLWCWIKMQQRA